MEHQNLLKRAAEYHEALPDRIQQYLNERGISARLVDFFFLGWDGSRITIPIFDRDGNVVSFKLAKDPDDQTDSPKMLATPGAHAELYGWDDVVYKPEEIVICEGEFDRLVLKAQGFRSVTSTGGARTFRPEWAKEFEAIPRVYVCFDRDEAGRQGALEVGQRIPRAKIIELPEEVGEGGDVTDFFVRLGRTDEDFRALMQAAKPAPAADETPRQVRPPTQLSREGRERIERVKTAVAIATVVGRYVKLEPSGENLMGRCPFHDDEHPSLTVYPETGTFYCFGCGTHGDAIDFLRKVERLGFREALDALEGFNQQHGEEAA